MAARDPDQIQAVRVAPSPRLLRNAVLSYLLIPVTLFGSLYCLAIPRGTWPMLLAGQLVTVAVVTLTYVRYRMTYIAVTGQKLVERGFLSPSRRAPLSRVASVLLAETYRSHSPDSTPQLLVRDVDGRRLLRMRGASRADADIHRVADALGSRSPASPTRSRRGSSSRPIRAASTGSSTDRRSRSGLYSRPSPSRSQS